MPSMRVGGAVTARVVVEFPGCGRGPAWPLSMWESGDPAAALGQLRPEERACGDPGAREPATDPPSGNPGDGD